MYTFITVLHEPNCYSCDWEGGPRATTLPTLSVLTPLALYLPLLIVVSNLFRRILQERMGSKDSIALGMHLNLGWRDTWSKDCLYVLQGFDSPTGPHIIYILYYI